MDTIHIGKGFSAVVGAFDPAFAQYLHQLDAIDYVEPNKIYSVQAVAAEAAAAAAAPAVRRDEVLESAAPSWGLARISQRGRVDMTRRLTRENMTGAGVHVYVFDTGINTDHPELKGRVTHVANFIDYEGDADSSGHGTHVAGIIGGVTTGVAPDTQIHSIKILDRKGDGTTVALIRGKTDPHLSCKAIEMVSGLAEKGKAIINLSLSGPRSKAIDDALTSAAIDHQIPIFAAAGNTADDACQYTPAANPAVFAVGASDREDNVALFSAFGDCVRIYAPGVDITSSWLGAETHSLDGTSMANPHVAGIAALLLSQRNFDSVEELYHEITAMATKDVLSSSHGNDKIHDHNLLAYTGV
ncbi:peptidase S8/S53 domain-containing protein [Dichotomocladium elegans]|nr:peptidase S8/S53 domain-containing protein [Dichotomocladium elegans]